MESGAKPRSEPGKAAVLLPIYKNGEDYHIIFTKRSSKTRYHRGEISFPGGAYEEADGDLISTALRESREEIGLEPEDVRIVGELSGVMTLTSQYMIFPFVGVVPHPYEFRINMDEVEEIIEAPISQVKRRDEYIWVYQGKVIWGATAAIFEDFLEFLSSREAD